MPAPATALSERRAPTAHMPRRSPHSVAPPDKRRAEERRLLARYARTRDPILLEDLVKRFMPLARALASRYRGGREPFEDLVQVASLGLVKAIGRFDPDRGFEFASFAVPTILGELRRHFRDHAWSVHLDRGLQERNARVEKAIAELPQRLGRSPWIGEISNRLGLSAEEVLEAIDAGNAHHALSMDGPWHDSDNEDHPPVAESLGEDDHSYDAVEYGASIAPVLSELSRRDRTVLHLRFVEDLTQSEIAAEIGVSQMQVSRILRATLQRLREQVPEADQG
ncbi:MAG TPA: SigB/SigF/SigG family RNA polymerase sigma factor [Solirubrobacterales bacterium]|nr:SigB/SigF/SigG family RNA polymerase sigma factor [Solirubrobacterales bacterium]HZA88960.1 SigB/SigF/SigG family RNA polymerase sigma factor [Solirubrobacterales bacterium]